MRRRVKSLNESSISGGISSNASPFTVELIDYISSKYKVRDIVSQTEGTSYTTINVQIRYEDLVYGDRRKAFREHKIAFDPIQIYITEELVNKGGKVVTSTDIYLPPLLFKKSSGGARNNYRNRSAIIGQKGISGEFYGGSDSPKKAFDWFKTQVKNMYTSADLTFDNIELFDNCLYRLEPVQTKRSPRRSEHIGMGIHSSTLVSEKITNVYDVKSLLFALGIGHIGTFMDMMAKLRRSHPIKTGNYKLDIRTGLLTQTYTYYDRYD